MTRLLILFVFGAVVAVLGARPHVPAAHAQPIENVSDDAPRHALVIGSSGYLAAAPLKNAVNDAKLMAETLEALGFEVTEVLNAGYRELNRSIVRYANALPPGSISVVFFAGHGVQVSSKNYLLPVDADPETRADLPFLSVSADDLLSMFRKRPSAVNIFILDACRNNPFENDDVRSAIAMGAAGLAPILSGFRGSLIAYSTAPGKVALDGAGNNSPYTLALARAMKRPGLSIESVFKLARTQVIGATEYKQVPWENSSLTQDIFLAGPEAQVADPEFAVTQCDLLAGHPSDPERVFAGIDYALMRPGPAIEACRADMAKDPDNPRLMTQLARALAKNAEPEEAISLNQRAVELGYLGGYHNLGNHYKRGDGVARDLVRALELFEYAAERGHPEDAYNVGVLYRNGRGGVDQSFERAKEWLERSAQQDYPSAFDKLGLMAQRGEGQPRDPIAAIGHFRRGAELGDSSAIVNLGTAYRKGDGVEVDYETARRLFRQAAQLRRRSAYTNLGDMYRKGLGVDVDLIEALFWYQLAGRRGHGYSQDKAAEIAAGLDEQQIEEVDGRVQQWIEGDFG